MHTLKCSLRDKHYRVRYLVETGVDWDKHVFHILTLPGSQSIHSDDMALTIQYFSASMKLVSLSSWTWINYTNYSLAEVWKGDPLERHELLNMSSDTSDILYPDFVRRALEPSEFTNLDIYPEPYNGPWDVWQLPTVYAVETTNFYVKPRLVAENLTKESAQEHAYFEHADDPSPDKGDYRKYVVCPSGTSPEGFDEIVEAIKKKTSALQISLDFLEE